MVEHIQIGNRRIGTGEPCYVIAEAGVNHNGDLDLARRMIDVAAESGADAVKFQSFKTSKLVTDGAAKASYQTRKTNASESQSDMLRRLELDESAHVALMSHCATRGIEFLSTPFDEESADLLVRLGVNALKIPSGEVTTLPLLERIGAYGKPVILSTGMSTLGEVEQAVDALNRSGMPPLSILHCVSCYPAMEEDVNLKAMDTLREAFHTVVGYSDHTTGSAVALAAVARGATILEKHFTLDRELEGPDHAASLMPSELAALVADIRKVERALGDGIKRPAKREMETASVARKSLAITSDIAAGAVVTEEVLGALRPGTGIPISLRSSLLGRRVRHSVKAGTLLTLDMFA
jgi:N,N'-diacetyllegionaminate synthase